MKQGKNKVFLSLPQLENQNIHRYSKVKYFNIMRLYKFEINNNNNNNILK